MKFLDEFNFSVIMLILNISVSIWFYRILRKCEKHLKNVNSSLNADSCTTKETV